MVTIKISFGPFFHPALPFFQRVRVPIPSETLRVEKRELNYPALSRVPARRCRRGIVIVVFFEGL